MVLLEAMYFGKATVISDVEGSGMGWVVDDNVTGIKVKPADANALAGALKRLAADREELARMGQRGRQKVRSSSLKSTTQLQGLLEIYQHVTQPKSQELTSPARLIITG